MAIPKLTGTISLDPRSHKRLTDMVRLSEKLGANLNTLMDAEAKKTLVKMKKDAPYDTGRLRRNITGQLTTDQRVDFISEAIDPETKDDYAPVQEFGTRFQRAQPYFYKNIKAFNRRFEAGVRSIFRSLTSIGGRS